MKISRLEIATAVAIEHLIHTKLGNHIPPASKVTKEMTDILVSLEKSKEPQFIMIEGAPAWHR